MLGIPLIIDRSGDEENEIGRYEWIKVYGTLFGMEDKAEELFQKTADQMKINNKVENKNERND